MSSLLDLPALLNVKKRDYDSLTFPKKEKGEIQSKAYIPKEKPQPAPI